MLPLALAAALLLQAPQGWDPDEPQRYDEDRRDRHLELTAWGGSSLDLAPGGAFAPWAGAELGWRFSESVLSLLYEAHHYAPARADRSWTPVILARVEQRFETLRGLQGTFAFGIGAGRPLRAWEVWLQVALGLRAEAGPFFVRGELGFERQSDLRLGGGAGLAF